MVVHSYLFFTTLFIVSVTHFLRAAQDSTNGGATLIPLVALLLSYLHTTLVLFSVPYFLREAQNTTNGGATFCQHITSFPPSVPLPLDQVGGHSEQSLLLCVPSNCRATRVRLSHYHTKLPFLIGSRAPFSQK